MEDEEAGPANLSCVMGAMTELAEMIVETGSVEDTRDLACRIGRELRAGDFVALIGPLGAGKTAFVQGLAGALGVEGSVTSPTFVLMRLHRGSTPLCHVDAYRLDGTGDLMDIGLEDWLDEAVVALEWADTVPAALPPERLEVVIDYTDGGRRIRLRGVGRRPAQMVERMAENDDSGY